jgi:acetylornithine/succinyldiaminopimelate/putrescine aminotransferase
MGRTGSLFAYEQIGVEPDLLTLAKPIAGGLPMGAVLINDRIAATMNAGDHGTTFGGGPFVASVALHVLERVADPTLLDHVMSAGQWIGSQLVAISERTGRVRAIRGVGFIWGLDVTELASEVVVRARDAGLLVLTAGEHTVRILPPLVTSQEDLERGLAILEQVL